MFAFQHNNRNFERSSPLLEGAIHTPSGKQKVQAADTRADVQMKTSDNEQIQMTPKDATRDTMSNQTLSAAEPMVQKQDEVESEQESEEEGMTFEEIGEAISTAILHHAPTLANICNDRVDEVGLILSDTAEGQRHFNTLYDIYTGFFGLAFELLQTQEETTEAQRERFTGLQTSWENVQIDIENDNIAEIQGNLHRTRARAEQIKEQLVLMYREVYLSGEDSTTEIVISQTNEETTTLRNIADQITGLLGAINEADAALTSRQVAPVLTALGRANAVLNLILGWNFTGDLDSESQGAFDDLQNALAVGMTVASFTSAGALLPLFGHIPVLLGAISAQWDRVVEGLRSQNTDWWEIFGEMPYCAEEPGGCETLRYMESVFRASSFTDVQPPPEEAASFFLSRRDMFDTVAREVMERGGVPTESELLVFTAIDDESFTAWVHYNREWVWKLIYGERSFPRIR